MHDAGFAPQIDLDGVAEFLEYGYITDDHSIYEGVRKVPAGGLVEWTDNGLRHSAYWRLPQAPEASTISFEDAVEKTESIFLDAVKLRLEADVKVGALLSGGVDSSLVCWAIAKLGGNIGTFTIGTPNDPMDESAAAAATARSLQIPHQIIEIAPTDGPDAQDLAEAYGEPFACASALGMLRVSKAVKQQATVLLTGDGGDDIFLGYPEHKVFWMAQQLARYMPGAALPLWRNVRSVLPGSLSRARHFMDYAMGGIGAVASVHAGLPFYWSHDLLAGRLKDKNVAKRATPWSPDSARNLLTEFLQYDRETRFTGEYMTKVDGGAMRYAVEARSPFLDHHLWEFAGTLPFSLRLKNGTLKAILREIARRRVGERVATGAKKGFGVPVCRWLAGRWAPKFEESMRDSHLAGQGLINPAKVLASWKQYAQSGQVPMQFWYLFVLETWFRHQSARPTPALLQEQAVR